MFSMYAVYDCRRGQYFGFNLFVDDVTALRHFEYQYRSDKFLSSYFTDLKLVKILSLDDSNLTLSIDPDSTDCDVPAQFAFVDPSVIGDGSEIQASVDEAMFSPVTPDQPVSRVGE